MATVAGSTMATLSTRSSGGEAHQGARKASDNRDGNGSGVTLEDLSAVLDALRRGAVDGGFSAAGLNAHRSVQRRRVGADMCA